MSTIQTVQGANQVIPATVDPATSTAGEPSGTLLPSPISALALSGDPGAELAALVVQAGQAQQSSAQAARDVDEQMEVNEDNQEVAAMRKKADETRAAGIADGLGMVAEGGAAVAAVCVTPAPPAAGGKWDTRLGDALKAGGKVADGGFQVGSAFSKGAEASSDADATAHQPTPTRTGSPQTTCTTRRRPARTW